MEGISFERFWIEVVSMTCLINITFSIARIAKRLDKGWDIKK